MNTNINEIAKQTRETLKKEFPACKFSVTLQKYSGGRTMTIALMSADFEALANTPHWNDGYAQLNHHQLGRNFEEQSGTQVISNEWTVIPEGYAVSNGAYVSRKAWEVLKRAVEVGNTDNWDNSDSMTDYFDVNYYLDVQIGKWNKPFEVK